MTEAKFKPEEIRKGAGEDLLKTSGEIESGTRRVQLTFEGALNVIEELTKGEKKKFSDLSETEQLGLARAIAFLDETALNYASDLTLGIKTVSKGEKSDAIKRANDARQRVKNLANDFEGISRFLSQEEKARLGFSLDGEKKDEETKENRPEKLNTKELLKFLNNELKPLKDDLNNPASLLNSEPTDSVSAREARELYKPRVESARNRLAFFESIYSIDDADHPNLKLQIDTVLKTHILPAKKTVEALENRLQYLSNNEVEKWKSKAAGYKNISEFVRNFESGAPPFSLEGDADLSTALDTSTPMIDEAVRLIESEGFKQEQFEEIQKAIQIFGNMEISQYLFLIKDLRSALSQAENFNYVKHKNPTKEQQEEQKDRERAARELIRQLERLRKPDEETDVLSQDYFNKNILELFGTRENSQNKFTELTMNENSGLKKKHYEYVSRLRKFLGRPEEDEKTSNLLIEKYRKDTLRSIIHDNHTFDVHPGEQRAAALKITEEKLFALEEEFIEHAMLQNHKKLNTGKITKESVRKEAVKKWESFKELYETSWALIEFGIFKADAINVVQGTAQHEKILGIANKGDVMAFNIKFNKNALVGSIGEEMHQGEMYREGMGIVQMITFAVFEKMKSKDKKYTRNQGYTAGLMAEMIDAVCGKTEVEMWDGKTPKDHGLTKKSVNIKAELAKFPPHVQEVIKLFARWKIARDDLGSKAAIWHLGKNKGAFKFIDGGIDGKTQGFLAALPYKVGKNRLTQGHMASLLFINPLDTGFVDMTHVNDRDLIRAIKKVDEFFLYMHPQLRGVLYNNGRNPRTGVYEANYKYRPKHWWEDFPGLDHFFNRTEGTPQGQDYVESKNAFLLMLETAIASLEKPVPISEHGVAARAKEIIDLFDTNVGILMRYIGPYNDGTEDYVKKFNSSEVNQLNYVHELILAAYKFTIANLLINISPSKPIPIYEGVSRQSGVKNFLRSIPGVEAYYGHDGVQNILDPEYGDRMKAALDEIQKLNDNGTMAILYWKELTGKIADPLQNDDGSWQETPHREDGVTPFVDLDFKKRWRDEPVLMNNARSRLLNLEDEEEKEKYGHGLPGRKRMKIMSSPVEKPWSFSPTDVWHGIKH